MSRADAAPRIVEAAVAQGVAGGVAALSLQSVARAAGVSKALVLYHFADKDTLLSAVTERLVSQDVAALEAAAASADVLDAWREVGGNPTRCAERALLAGLLQDAALRAQAAGLQRRRASAATHLAVALFAASGLRPRIANSLVGRVLLAQLDGVAVDASRHGSELEAALDALALALLGLGD